MAWYEHNKFKLNLIIVLICILLINDYIQVNCFPTRGLNNLKEIQYNSTSFFCCKQISENNAILAYDFAKNYYLNNINNISKLNICKYLYDENDVLYNYHRRSPYSHYHSFLGMFNGYFVNLQFSHNFNNSYFEFLLKTDIFNNNIEQKISNKIHIYDNVNHQFFINSDALNLNGKLKLYENFDQFLIDKENSQKAENFASKNNLEILNRFNKSFNI